MLGKLILVLLSSFLLFARSFALRKNQTFDDRDPAVLRSPLPGWQDVPDPPDFDGTHAIYYDSNSGEPNTGSAEFKFTGKYLELVKHSVLQHTHHD